MFKEFERRFVPESNFPTQRLSDFRVAMDIEETDKDFTLKADLPGMGPEDVEISLEGEALVIGGEKHYKEETQSKDKAWHRRERTWGKFHRVLQLPPEADEANTHADFRKGVLTITIPKRESHVENVKNSN